MIPDDIPPKSNRNAQGKPKRKLTKEQLKSLPPEQLKKIKQAILRKRKALEQAKQETPKRNLPSEPPKPTAPKPEASKPEPNPPATAPTEGNVETSPIRSPLPGRAKRKGGVPEYTIGKIYYEQAKNFLIKRTVFHLLGLCFVIVIGLSCILWLTLEYKQKGEILYIVSEGLQALENDKLDTAESKFHHAQELYEIYYQSIRKQLWFNDGGLEISMIRAADGCRSLGLWQNVLQIYRQVSRNNPYGVVSFIGDAIMASQKEFAFSERWTDDEVKSIYQSLIESDPFDWGKGAIFQIRLTEWMGIRAIPVAERYERADAVIYGIPAVDREGEPYRFQVDAQFFYIHEQHPGVVDVFVPESMPPIERKRLSWYLNQNFACLIFCKQAGSDWLLQGIEGIALCENPLVDMFNKVNL